jgi:hypothetical protein
VPAAKAFEPFMEQFVKTTLLLTVIWTLFPFNAYAYVDPGSGTLLLQLLAAVGVGALFYVDKMKAFVRGLFSKEDAKSSDNNKGDKR